MIMILLLWTDFPDFVHSLSDDFQGIIAHRDGEICVQYFLYFTIIEPGRGLSTRYESLLNVFRAFGWFQPQPNKKKTNKGRPYFICIRMFLDILGVGVTPPPCICADTELLYLCCHFSICKKGGGSASAQRERSPHPDVLEVSSLLQIRPSFGSLPMVYGFCLWFQPT